MVKALRFGSAISALALAAALPGCAAQQKSNGFAGRVDKSNIGVATKALMALNAEDYATAVTLAERAVQNSPTDAGFRSLLGNAYFGAGRFASAESAYRDSLSLISNQPQVILKLALVEIAQGKNQEALAFLNGARSVLDSADFGLAVALAGDPVGAVNVLEASARQVGADARVRQNLALAYALSGEWQAARTIAAQDVPADQLDSRIQQWMALAKPVRPYEQVAALTGVKPATSDPGQPTRLALRSTDTRLAAVQPVVEPQPVVQPQAAPQPMTQPEAMPIAEAAPIPAPAFEPAPVQVAQAPAPIAEEPAYITPPPRPAKPAVRAASFVPKSAPIRRAALNRGSGRSTAVVQLGAYGSPKSVAAAWSNVARRYASLRDYQPVSARFSGPRGTVYRLSVKGFGSPREAAALCVALRRSGGSCFVRNVAGDAPVQFASL
jgi:Flp pilus assembly protein TadD